MSLHRYINTLLIKQEGDYLIEKILLDTRALDKIGLYGKLLSIAPGEYNLEFVKNLTHLSTTRLKSLLSSIQLDLQNLSPVNLSLHKNTLNLPKNLIEYNQYQQFLAQESISYKLLLSILTNQDENLLAFCQRNYISRSTCFRQTKKLQDHLKEFNVTLNQSAMALTGSEMVIRILLFNFIWHISLGDSLAKAFDQEIEELFVTYEGTKYKSKYEIGKKEALLHCKICLFRIKNGHATNLYQLTNQSFIPSGENLDFFSAFFEIIDSAIDILEINALFFLFYYWPMLTSAADVRLPIIQDCYKHEKSELKELMAEFEAHCQKFLCDFDFDHQSFLYMNTYLTLLKFCIFKQKVPLLNFFETTVIKDKYPLHTILTNTIQSFWRKIANRKGYEWLKACYTDLAFYQACLLYPIYIDKEQKYKLKVAFVYVSNYLVSMEVFNICERLPYVEIERITLPTEEPFDFYILSSPQLLPPFTTEENTAIIDFCRYRDFETNLCQKLLAAFNEKIQRITANSA